MKRKIFVFALFLTLIVFNSGAWALNVDIYSGLSTDAGGGAPYTGLVGSFTSPDIMFATNTGYAWHPFGLGAFGADITGLLSVASAGSYSFTLNSDDGSMLYIDSGLVVDNGGAHGPTIVSGSAILTAGFHAFEVQFYEDFGGPSGVDLYLPRGVTYGSAVPEPATMLLLGLGLIGVAGMRRKMHK
jgi:hypothetical protein